MNREPMMCPQCGIPMNRHADKPSEPRDAAEARQVETGLGVMIEAAHTCPGCGLNASRRESGHSH